MDLPKTLKRRYLIGLFLVATLIISAEVVVQWHLNIEVEEAHIINISGRQRMLSQKIAKDILKLKAFGYDSDDVKVLRKDLSVWSKNHENLKLRQEGIFKGENSSTIKELFRNIEPSFRAIQVHAACFAEEDISKCSERSMPKLLKAEAEYLSLMDEIVAMYSTDLSAHFTKQRYLELGMMFLILFLLACEAIFIFEPAVKAVRKNMEALKQEKSVAAERFKLMALGEMAGGVAHEINNPLAIIRGRAELIRDQLAKPVMSKEQTEKNVEAIMRTVDRIGTIVKGLLKLSRDELPVDLQVESVETILSDAIAICQEKLKNKGIQIRVVSMAQDIHVKCRPVELSQVILNLISNAAHAAEESEEKIIRIKVTRSKAGIQFFVSNSGDKIPADIQKKIFDPFFTTRPVGEGTGLGLSVSKSLIEKMNGDIYLDDNKPDTTFVVHFPDEETPRLTV